MNTVKIPRSLYRVCSESGRHELVIFLDHRPPFTLGCDSFNGLMKMMDEFFVPTAYTHNFNSLKAYNRSVAICLEDTQEIDLELISDYTEEKQAA